MKRFCLAATCAVVLLTAAVASAQTATVGGSVSNAQGGVIADAEVTLRVLPPPGAPAMPANMPGMAPERTTTSAADGTFTFTQVPPGQYVLLVDAPGFERSSQEVTVANQPQTLTVALEPLEVPGAAPSAAARRGNRRRPARRCSTASRRSSSASPTSSPARCCRSPKRASSASRSTSTRTANRHDEPVPGREKEVTYQRERVYRRQTHQREDRSRRSRDAERASDQDRRRARRRVTQCAGQTKGDPTRRRTTMPTRWRRPTCSSPPSSRSTRASSPTSSA